MHNVDDVSTKYTLLWHLLSLNIDRSFGKRVSGEGIILQIYAIHYSVGFEVLTAVSKKMAVFWVVAPYSLVEVYHFQMSSLPIEVY
jgi:hypothetical protein